MIGCLVTWASIAGATGVASARVTEATADSIFILCPTDTLVRPGRYVDLVNGFVNGTSRDFYYVCYRLSGARGWPEWSPIDCDQVFAHRTSRFLFRIEVPDSAADGVNVITWRAGGLVCTYEITIPELIADATAEPSVDRVRLSWMVADSSADTAMVFRRDSGGIWYQIGDTFGSVGHQLVFEDHDVTPGVEYQYRLGLPVGKREIIRGVVSASVPDLLSGASAKASVGRISLAWIAADPAAYAARVYRSTRDESWRLLATITTDGGAPLTYEDGAVVPGVAYRYRLGISVGGREFFRGEVTAVAAVAPDALQLDRLSSNPTSGPLRVAVTLGRGDPARLDLFDAGGRRLRTREMRLQQERSVVDAAEGVSLRAGLYLVRLSQGTRQRTLRFSVVR